VTALILLLVASLLAYMVLSAWIRRERTATGLRNETLEWTDDSAVPSPTLRSKKYGLVGRPDQLVRVGKVLVPIEQKPRARRLQPSHVLQVAAQCLLVQEVYGVRPPHGVVVLGNGIREHVEFTDALEQHLLEVMAQMRSFLNTDTAPAPRWVNNKCRACSFRKTCWTSDAS
jgi:CRISPR-associated exonuclease Cas4